MENNFKKELKRNCAIYGYVNNTYLFVPIWNPPKDFQEVYFERIISEINDLELFVSNTDYYNKKFKFEEFFRIPAFNRLSDVYKLNLRKSLKFHLVNTTSRLFLGLNESPYTSWFLSYRDYLVQKSDSKNFVIIEFRHTNNYKDLVCPETQIDLYLKELKSSFLPIFFNDNSLFSMRT